MSLSPRIKFYLIPSLFLLFPALLGLALESYNRYYRGLSTPFLGIALGLILLSLFFWVKKRWMYLGLVLASGFYLSLLLIRWVPAQNTTQSWVYYYGHWQLNTQNGLLRLSQPLGKAPPKQGSYISCHFMVQSLKDYWNIQPRLCTAFDATHRLRMSVGDQLSPQGTLREFHLNFFSVDRKSLLGEPLDRWALRLAFREESGWFKSYQLQNIYQVYERQAGPNQFRIVESVSRDPTGKLKSFTASPLTKLHAKDSYAVYDHRGILVKIPRWDRRSFAFPAQIDLGVEKFYRLPKILGP